MLDVDKRSKNTLAYGKKLTTADLMHMPVTDEFGMPGEGASDIYGYEDMNEQFEERKGVS
jgi:hypothetical protein